jgi:hypothetical protein
MRYILAPTGKDPLGKMIIRAMGLRLESETPKTIQLPSS